MKNIKTSTGFFSFFALKDNSQILGLTQIKEEYTCYRKINQKYDKCDGILSFCKKFILQRMFLTLNPIKDHEIFKHSLFMLKEINIF